MVMSEKLIEETFDGLKVAVLIYFLSHLMNVHAVCSDTKIPLSSASIQDRSVRADIAASFQVSISL